MKLSSSDIRAGEPIDPQFAFCAPGDDEPTRQGGNENPELAWSEVPEGARSFVILCMDPDVPTRPELVNRDDQTIPLDLPRTDFYHWVIVDIPASERGIARGRCSSGVTVGGKRDPEGPAGSRQGLNDYTGFLAGSDMAGKYFGYDGPCPPWNDERLHHYRFTLYAVDRERLDLPEVFNGEDVLEAMQGYVLATACLVGTYTLNPAVAGEDS